MTDGVPEAPLTSQHGTCNPTLAEAVQVTRQCASGQDLSTYVLGVGPNLSNLDQIANAGRTDQAYIVESGDVSEQVLEALNAIRGNSLLPCDFRVPDAPEGEELDYDLVNVVLTSSGDNLETIPFVGGEASCSSEAGWYYTEDHERIALCPTSCKRLRAESVGGTLAFALGCKQVVSIR